MFKKNNGFTLIEVLIVMVIIGLISNMAVVNYGNKTEEAKKVIDQGNMVNISTALELYTMDKDSYPDDTGEKPLGVLLGGEGKTKYLKIKEDELDKYDYVLSSDKKSYTISIKKP